MDNSIGDIFHIISYLLFEVFLIIINLILWDNFTDFGDYSDQYYSVQTTEGEQISQLIAGYIDIILKKQRAKDHIGIEGDDGSAMVEDTVSPIK